MRVSADLDTVDGAGMEREAVLRRWISPVLLLALLGSAASHGSMAASYLSVAQEERMVAIDTLFRQGGEEGAKGIAAFLRDRVITSYSIHYTKLYETVGIAMVLTEIARFLFTSDFV